MLISNKLHSFRNFIIQNYTKSFDFDKRIYQYKRTQNEPIGAERRKGAGEYGPQCPTGAVPKGLGVEDILYGKMNFDI